MYLNQFKVSFSNQTTPFAGACESPICAAGSPEQIWQLQQQQSSSGSETRTKGGTLATPCSNHSAVYNRCLGLPCIYINHFKASTSNQTAPFAGAGKSPLRATNIAEQICQHQQQ
jgi:hypothetical protein